MTVSLKPARLSRAFLITAVLLGLGGMLLGMGMGILEDFRLKTVHVHINLIGFVTMFLAGLFYRLHPAVAGKLALAQYASGTIGLALMAAGLAGIYLSIPSIVWMVKPGATLVLASMVIFVWNVIIATSPKAGGRLESDAPSALRVIDEPAFAAKSEAARIIENAVRSASPRVA